MMVQKSLEGKVTISFKVTETGSEESTRTMENIEEILRGLFKNAVKDEFDTVDIDSLEFTLSVSNK